MIAPPLPPNDTPELPPLKSRLALLFEQHRLLESVQWLHQCSPEKVETEITLAFAAVPWAPSAFLQCVGLCLRLPSVNISRWIEVAVRCIMNTKYPQIWETDSWIAGTMLPSIQHLPIELVADFALAYCVKTETLRVFSSYLLNVRVKSAAKFIVCLDMKHLLPVQDVLDAVMKHKDYDAGDILVQGDPENERQFVELLIDRKVKDKVIKKRLSVFNLPASNFPVYFEQRQQATLCFLIRSSEFEEALTFVQGSVPHFFACRLTIRHLGPYDPATKQFVFRSGLVRNFPEIDISEEAGKAFADKDPIAGCLSIVGAIGEDNIVFVDTPTALQECADYLQTQLVMGFDAEWRPVLICTSQNDAKAPCALVQLASREKAFVVDVIVLHDQGSILAPVLQSETVLKLGFSAKNDVKVLRPFLAADDGADHVMSMLVDLQAITKDLPAPGASNRNIRGLAALAEACLGSPLDKRVRMLNWERRPLTRSQLHYAALDANVQVQIYDKMQEHHSVDSFGDALERCTEKYVK